MSLEISPSFRNNQSSFQIVQQLQARGCQGCVESQLGSGELANLASITALNLERNVIQQLEPDVFYGINDTLSSLSLLNNLLTSYPTEAITSLRELRVSRRPFVLPWFLLVGGGGEGRRMLGL